jgi:hypothetical protein
MGSERERLVTRPAAPDLVERIVRRLESAGHALTLEELARDVLSTPPGRSTALGAAVLEPLLRGERRVAETPLGWVIRAEAAPQEPALDGPFVALGVVAAPPGLPPPWRVLRFDGDGREAGEGGEQDDRPAGPHAFGWLRQELIVAARGDPDLSAAGLPAPAARAIPLTRLGRAVAGTPARAPLDEVAARLGIAHTVEEGAAGSARLAATVWLDLRERLREEGLLDTGGLETLLATAQPAGELEGHLAWEDLDGLPRGPGVYRLLGDGGDLLYVGKSVNVRARVASYFRGAPRDDKDRRLRTEVTSVRAERLGSEPEALLREQELIRRHRPPLNVHRSVGERTALGGSRVMILAGPTARRRTLLMVRGGALVARMTVGLRRDGRARARRLLVETYFTGADAPRDERARQGGRLLASWLRRHPNRVLWFDPTEARDAEEAAARLERYLDADPDAGPLYLRSVE